MFSDELKSRTKSKISDTTRKIMSYNANAYNTLYAAAECIDQNQIKLAKAHIASLTGNCCSCAAPEIHEKHRARIFKELST